MAKFDFPFLSLYYNPIMDQKQALLAQQCHAVHLLKEVVTAEFSSVNCGFGRIILHSH